MKNTTPRYTELDLIALNADRYKEQIKFFIKLFTATDESGRFNERLQRLQARYTIGLDCFIEFYFPNEQHDESNLCREQIANMFRLEEDGELELIFTHSHPFRDFFSSRQKCSMIPKQLFREVETFLSSGMAEAIIKPIEKSMTTTSDSAKTSILWVMREYFLIVFADFSRIIGEIEKESR